MIGEALAAICDDPRVLAKLGGPLGDAARAAVGRTKQQRAAALAAVHVLRGIHPTWVAAGALDGDSPVARWLARSTAAALAPLPAIDVSTRPRTIIEATRMSGEALAAWLAEVGADQVAHALGAQAAVIAEHAMKRITIAPRAGNLGPRRAAIGRATVDNDGTAESTAHILSRVGARAIAPYTDAIVRRQLALRLPRTLGLAVLFELRDHDREPLDASPTWTALAAN